MGDINVGRTLSNKKSYENILVYNILYEIYMDKKPLRIGCDKVDRMIHIYDEIIYL